MARASVFDRAITSSHVSVPFSPALAPGFAEEDDEAKESEPVALVGPVGAEEEARGSGAEVALAGRGWN